jgi:hypothetical protein
MQCSIVQRIRTKNSGRLRHIAAMCWQAQPWSGSLSLSNNAIQYATVADIYVVSLVKWLCINDLMLISCLRHFLTVQCAYDIADLLHWFADSSSSMHFWPDFTAHNPLRLESTSCVSRELRILTREWCNSGYCSLFSICSTLLTQIQIIVCLNLAIMQVSNFLYQNCYHCQFQCQPVIPLPSPFNPTHVNKM